MKKAIAVLISDVHYDLNTLEIADTAMRMAIKHANDLEVRLIVAGDLHNTKANLRAECLNRLDETLRLCNNPVYLIRGNHDSLNEKSRESALNVLEREDYDYETAKDTGSITIINEPRFINHLGAINGNSIHLIPYHHDPQQLKKYLAHIDKNSVVIMHQGIQGSNSGEYFQDLSAITAKDVAGLRVISGHYHARQTIPLPQGGVWDYIGNPYTLNYGEANDPEKGYQVLHSDGSLEFIPTKLRKHIIIELDASFEVLNEVYLPRLNDLTQVKVYGTKEELSKVTREAVTGWLTMPPAKLELIPTQADQPVVAKKANGELLDELIEGLNASSERKASLKELWRKLVS